VKKALIFSALFLGFGLSNAAGIDEAKLQERTKYYTEHTDVLEKLKIWCSQKPENERSDAENLECLAASNAQKSLKKN